MKKWCLFLSVYLCLCILAACGAAGGVAHNLGQIAAAAAIAQTPGLFLYLPVLILCGIFTGAFTGLCAQLLLERIRLK